MVPLTPVLNCQLHVAAAVGIENSTAAEDSYGVEAFGKMMDYVHMEMGTTLDALEASVLLQGNTVVPDKDSMFQSAAMYGRAKEYAATNAFSHLALDPKMDTFCDIGSGPGIIPLLAAYTKKCDARGIELIETRHNVAEEYNKHLKVQHENNPSKQRYRVGEVSLRHGRLEVQDNRDFLTVPGPGRSRMKLFFNNYNGVFSNDSSKPAKSTYTLDHFVAALFAKTPPGSMLITLHELPMGDIVPYSEAEELLKKIGHPQNDNASFYSKENIFLGDYDKCVSWSSSSTGGNRELAAYKYTRLPQDSVGGQAVFLCMNKLCEKARNQTPIIAAAETEVRTRRGRGLSEMRLVLTSCCSAPTTGRRRSATVGVGKRE